MATPAAPVTLGESLAHLSRRRRWTMAVLSQMLCPGLLTLLLLYAIGPSFLVRVPWRLALLLLWGAYVSVLFMVRSYAELFLPRTPVVLVKRLMAIGMWGGGLLIAVIGSAEGVVFALHVRDTRVLAACTSAVATLIAALVAFWVWLARKYGGSDTGLLTSGSSESTAAGGGGRHLVVVLHAPPPI